MKNGSPVSAGSRGVCLLIHTTFDTATNLVYLISSITNVNSLGRFVAQMPFTVAGKALSSIRWMWIRIGLHHAPFNCAFYTFAYWASISCYVHTLYVL